MTKPECTCTPTLIRKHTRDSHDRASACEETCPVVHVRHSASCPRIVRPGRRAMSCTCIPRAVVEGGRVVDVTHTPPCPMSKERLLNAQPMSHAVADLILRQSMALLDEGTGPRSYGSVLGPDDGPQDVALILQAVDVIGQENILDRYFQDEIQAMRGEHG